MGEAEYLLPSVGASQLFYAAVGLAIFVAAAVWLWKRKDKSDQDGEE